MTDPNKIGKTEPDQHHLSDPKSKLENNLDSLEMTPEKAYYLQRIQVISEIQNEISTWAKRRCWLIVVIFLIMGYIGFQSVFNAMVSTEIRSAIKATVTAELASENAKEVSKKVREEADKYIATVEDLSNKASKVDEKLSNIESDIDTAIKHAIEKIGLKVTELTDRLDTLGKLVEKNSSISEEHKENLIQYQSQISELELKASEIKGQFDDNSEYKIVVLYSKGTLTEKLAIEIIDELTSQGFKATQAWDYAEENMMKRIQISYHPSSEVKLKQIESAVRKIYVYQNLKVPEIIIWINNTNAINEINVFL